MVKLIHRAAACGILVAGLSSGTVAADPAAPRDRGSVQVKVKADGTKVIFNESVVHRTRRVSSRLESPDAELAHWIELYARRYDLNPRLVQAVIQVESGYNARALSSKGAMGLMQLMPETAGELGVTNPYDAEQNIRGGTRYLREQLNRFSNLSLALAAYNAGPTAVRRHGGVPPYRETRHYVRRVLALLGVGGAAPPRTTADARSAPTADAQTASTAERPGAERPAVTAPSEAAKPKVEPGKKVYLSRGKDNRIFVTTVPPKKSS